LRTAVDVSNPIPPAEQVLPKVQDDDDIMMGSGWFFLFGSQAIERIPCTYTHI
jgi:hypothetical protein